MWLWSRPALIAYAIGFSGMVVFDHLWALLVPSLSDLDWASKDAQITEDDFDYVVRSHALFLWAEGLVLLFIIGMAARLNPTISDGTGYPFLVLVTIFITIGREAFGLHVAFSAPFGLKIVGAWLAVLMAMFIWKRVTSQH